MQSLKDVYFAMADQDHTKLAQAQAVEEYGHDFADVDPGLVKQAQDYDTVGRVMAHNVFTDLVKEAMDEAMPGAPEEAKKKELAKILAKAKGEKSEEEDEEDEGSPEAEKKAHVQAAIIGRMQQDPEYVSYLLSKYDIV
jgi:hypothetical protein